MTRGIDRSTIQSWLHSSARIRPPEFARAPPAPPCSPGPTQRTARSCTSMRRPRSGHMAAMASRTCCLQTQMAAREPPLPPRVAQPQAPPALVALQVPLPLAPPPRLAAQPHAPPALIALYVPLPLASALVAASWGSHRSSCNVQTVPCTSRRCLDRLPTIPSRGPTTAPTARSSRPSAQGA